MSDWASRTTGERIKYLRRTAELTQTQLADLTGISVATVQKAEQNKGELSIGYLLKLAAGLRTDVAVILGQQAPRHDMGLEARTALRQLADAVHESALGDWQGIGEPSGLDDLTRAHGLAYTAAYRVGRDKSLYGTHFGPTAANTEAVGIRVALGDFGRALKLEKETRLPKSMPKLARNRYKLDVALAQVEAKLYDKAGDTLIEVGLDAPEWVKHQALPGAIGRRLAKVSTSKVHAISEIIGVPLIV
ncbi:helix-turn-helix domain-containing protein [Streptomyces sp. DSM 41534]